MIDVRRARRETPGCEHVTHLNNAGASLPPQPVLDAVIGHLQLEARVGGYEAHEQNEKAIDRFYGAAAELVGAGPGEIAFSSSATRAWDMAFYGFPFERGDRILTAVAEYISNYIAYIQVANRAGVEVVPVPSDEYGQVSVDSLRRLVDERVKLIAITHVPTNGGLVNPAAEIGAVAREAGIPYLLDACQSVGQLPVDVEEIGCDVLSATGRKYLRGPRGTGFLYVRPGLLETLEPPAIDLRSATWTSADRYELRTDAGRFEQWEADVAARLGLKAAVDYLLELGIEQVAAAVQQRAERLRELLGDRVRDLGSKRSGIVSFAVDGMPAEGVRDELARRDITVTVSGRTSTLLDMDARGIESLVRASPHYFVSGAQLEEAAAAVASL
jgi:selenocysteine lyase/cysteine desulfurase